MPSGSTPWWFLKLSTKSRAAGETAFSSTPSCQHEGVDENAVSPAARDFVESFRNHQGVEPEGILINAPVLECQRRRFSVRDHDDLPHVLFLAAQNPFRQAQPFARIRIIR